MRKGWKFCGMDIKAELTVKIVSLQIKRNIQFKNSKVPYLIRSLQKAIKKIKKFPPLVYRLSIIHTHIQNPLSIASIFFFSSQYFPYLISLNDSKSIHRTTSQPCRRNIILVIMSTYISHIICT